MHWSLSYRIEVTFAELPAPLIFSTNFPFKLNSSMIYSDYSECYREVDIFKILLIAMIRENKKYIVDARQLGKYIKLTDQKKHMKNLKDNFSVDK